MATKELTVTVRGRAFVVQRRSSNESTQTHVYDNGNDDNKVEVLVPFTFDLDDVNYNAWSLDMCSLLDAIDVAFGADDPMRVRQLLMGRFKIAEKHGVKVVILPGTLEDGLGRKQ